MISTMNHTLNSTITLRSPDEVSIAFHFQKFHQFFIHSLNNSQITSPQPIFNLIWLLVYTLLFSRFHCVWSQEC